MLAMCICCVAIPQESAKFKLANSIKIAHFQTLFIAKSSCQRFVNLVFQMHLTSITRKDDLSFTVLVKFLNMAKKVIVIFLLQDMQWEIFRVNFHLYNRVIPLLKIGEKLIEGAAFDIML